jgi:hypothetical protein
MMPDAKTMVRYVRVNFKKIGDCNLNIACLYRATAVVP